MNFSKPNETSIQIKTEMIGEFQKIAFIGKLLYGQTEKAKALILEHITQAPGYIFDTRDMEAIDSTGFGLLITITKQIQTAPGSVVIIVESASLLEYFTIAKFDLIFPLVDTELQAVALLKNKPETTLLLEEY
ncbi:STAS domain-containing protein [Aneurinibacillus sp. REN35]|uniref:STAS domain-containing protein n=1 Tax=Aneurinibacillus sp. REN35 TaxID=3237286 RepID=UPI00352733B9